MLQELIDFIQSHDWVNSKFTLASLVSDKFNCVKDKSVYYTNSFAIRFSKGQGRSDKISNNILALSMLQKYDDRPFIVCICTSDKNYLLLANTTMLSKISHSSKELRVNNVKGSFKGADIIRNWGGITNTPENFMILFAIHQNVSFEENLVRLVEATNDIVPTGKKFDAGDGNNLSKIMQSPKRAASFVKSSSYVDLLNDLNARTKAYENEILIAACIENVNLRERIIEYLIAGEDAAVRKQLIDTLATGNDFPRLVTRDTLGDYSKYYLNYYTEADIKTQIMISSSVPKGYNLDKMLEFLTIEDSVFMMFFVGIDYEQRSIKTKLISMFQNDLIDGTVIQTHWIGRSSRGASQFNGEIVKRIILDGDNSIDVEKSKMFLEQIVAM